MNTTTLHKFKSCKTHHKSIKPNYPPLHFKFISPKPNYPPLQFHQNPTIHQ